MQTVLDFTKQMSHRENNSESQAHFEKNEKHFTKQCKVVYTAMLKGEKLTTTTALLRYGIGDLRRRVKDLIDIHKINVKSNWIKTKHSRCKEYYL